MQELFNDFSMGLFVWQTVLFVTLIFLLKKYAWGPILSSIEDREQGIKDALDSAQNARQEMETLSADNQKILQEAKIERDSILKEAREMKESIISEAKSAASTEADKVIESAREQIQTEKLAAITELKNQVANLSIDIAEKVLKSELADKQKQKEFVEAALNDADLN
jgi:F-type H+-transporting ATPase subunit b